jgi:para-nitrobenzyl esterase
MRRLLADSPIVGGDGTASSDPTVVDAPCGTLRGEIVDGNRVFRGVPYAEPPVGPLRFRPTAKLKPWTGERDATKFAPSAMQPGDGHSEDCLYLNIIAPGPLTPNNGETRPDKGPYPVYVWIHGGGFTGGSANDATYQHSTLPQEGIISVTVAYRLGVFGFLDAAPLLGAEYAGSANNAVRDLIMALEWIQENIAAFGGDPNRVTIGGESAGAKLTGILLGTPAARPLFRQAISESGGAERVSPSTSASAEVSEGFGKVWLSKGNADYQSLLTAPASTLIDAQQDFTGSWPKHYPLRPEVDGKLLSRMPIESIARGSSRGKRILIGTNSDESALFIGPHPSKDPGAADLGNLTQAKFDDVFQHYKEVYPEMTDEQRRIRALSAEEYVIPTDRLIEAHAKHGDAYVYRLDFAETSGDLKGYAFHALDIGLVWNRPNAHVANAADEALLSQRMQKAWAAFIRGEEPAAEGLPVWEKYSRSDRTTMVLDVTSHVDKKPREAEYRLWDGV